MTFGRRVVTGHDADGTAVFRSDGPAPLTLDAPGGFGVSEVLWLDGPVRGFDDGVDRTEVTFPLEPPPGGASARIVRLPPTAGRCDAGRAVAARRRRRPVRARDARDRHPRRRRRAQSARSRSGSTTATTCSMPATS